MRTFNFGFEVICANDQGQADLAQVENLIDLAMQELVYDDRFVAALDEDSAVTIRVSQIGGQKG
jgi:hypothetical protein